MRNVWKSLKNRLVVICYAVVMAAALAGCSAGSTVDTTLVLENDLSGVRRMSIVIDNGVFDQYFNGTAEDINGLLETSCPKELTWSYSEESGQKRYTVELAFSSPEDYAAKVAAILGREPEINIVTPNTVWASGIRVSEDFSDTELLQWMQDLLVENGFVDASNAGYIFSSGQLSVVYNDAAYDSSWGSSINVEQVEYVALDDVHILTDVNGMNSYDRRVVFRIPASSMERKGDAIKEYMNSLASAGVSGEWSDDEGETVYTLSASDLTAEELSAFDAAVFASEGVGAVRTDVSEKVSPFVFEELLTETLDLSGFATGSDASVHCTYQVKTVEPYSASLSYDGVTPGNEGYDSQMFSGYKILNDFWLHASDGRVEIPMLTQHSYYVKGLTVDTDRKFGSDWERTSSFVFETVPSDEDQDAIVARMEARAGIQKEDGVEEAAETEEPSPVPDESAPGEDAQEDAAQEDMPQEGVVQEEAEKDGIKPAEVKISSKTKDGVFTLKIEQRGRPEEIQLSSLQLFENRGVLAYAKEREIWKVSLQEAFEEVINFGDLLEHTSEDFKIDYSVHMGMFSKMQYCSSDAAQMDGGSLNVTFNNRQVNVTYVGTKFCVTGLLFWLFLAAGTVCLIFLVLKVFVFGRKKKPAEDPAAAKAEESGAQPSAAGSKPPVAGFCEKCGTPREPGAKFCEMCGTKFED